MEPLPIVDRPRLAEISRGSAERAREYFEALVDDAEIACRQLRDALAAGDDHALVEIAHSLKGMALEVGAPRLAAAAAVLQAERDRALHIALVEAIGKACAELRDALATFEA